VQYTQCSDQQQHTHTKCRAILGCITSYSTSYVLLAVHGVQAWMDVAPTSPAQAEGGLKVLLNMVSFSSSTSDCSRAFSCSAHTVEHDGGN
jgi:hypothetical protein